MIMAASAAPVIAAKEELPTPAEGVA